MIKNLLLIFVSLGIWNCSYIHKSEIKQTDMSADNILTALEERNDLAFDNKTRDLYTVVGDSSKFEYIFPNTDISCGYVIRYFFHTNIHLGKEMIKLISMDGSIFNIENFNSIEEEFIISLAKNVLITIGDMYHGSSELQAFLNSYPEVVISN